jgi:hypothetical protein
MSLRPFPNFKDKKIKIKVLSASHIFTKAYSTTPLSGKTFLARSVPDTASCTSEDECKW